MYSPAEGMSKASSKWLAWLTRSPCAGTTAPSESETVSRSSPERSCARQRDAEKEQKRGVDVGAAQIDSPKATGDVWRYFTGLVGGGCWTVALVPLGPESRVSPHGETI